MLSSCTKNCSRFIKGNPKFEDLFYKFAYCSYYLRDWLQAENLFKQFVEVFPNQSQGRRNGIYAGLYLLQAIAQSRTGSDQYPENDRVDADLYQYASGSAEDKEANTIIDELRAKLEVKDYKNAELVL